MKTDERIEQEEKKNRRIGLFVSLGLHAAMLILFLVLVAWQPPDPPLPEYGIELNFGIDDQGSGEEPVTNPAEPTEDEQPAETQPEETEPVEPVEPVTEPEPEPEPVETTEPTTPAVTQPEPSPVTAEPEPKKKPVEKPKEKPKETPKEPVKEQPKQEVKATYPGAKSESDSKNTKSGGSSQGDDSNKKGDKGDPEGSLDSRNQYGKQGGGGGGSSLDMAGWMWDARPKVNDKSQEEGRIVFEVKIDESGEILSVRTLEKTVSPAIEQIYRREVERLTFSRTGDNQRPAPISTGKITFIIKSN